MGEKTEKATPKKLRDARNKGQVAKSQDLPSAFTFIVSIWVTLAAGKFLFDHLGSFTVMAFQQIAKGSLDTAIPDLYFQGLTEIFITSIPVLGIVSVIGVLINFLIIGPMFALEVFKFDIKKFDPISNLKAKFKLKTLIELLKSIIKISIACYIVYDVMWKSLPVLIRAVSLPIDASLMVFYTFLMEVVIKVGLFFIIIAVADFIYQRKSFANEMKMEKFEVKQEYKNSEGDPHIKSKRRQIAQEIAYQEGPGGAVKRAQAVVTNPTHLAIAIGYKKEFDAAPFVMAKGEDIMAERIVKYAKEFNVPVVRNIKLARTLWEEADVNEFVPEETYELIAEILRWVAALNTDTQYEYTEK
ncbi:type III secretion system export apparatus subunit SctU [Parachlamydia sp. AcF125]|uniref:type III secretion system export apparatus subunit SctU n=1 Tax=Parachlamydia sp. AcF125 TaxID=2795736 RepID=UPI001BC98F8F|nr:type III secretion system export apparatus subunit SctU [Parachlamydia sp. AcF125]MBS4169078.1 Yop proteins translocation protein U [Parachlamydia sp. AcF125]